MCLPNLIIHVLNDSNKYEIDNILGLKSFQNIF